MEEREHKMQEDISSIDERIARLETKLISLKEKLRKLKEKKKQKIENDAKQLASNSVAEKENEKRKKYSYVTLEYESTDVSSPRKKHKLANKENENGHEIVQTEEIKSEGKKKRKYEVEEGNDTNKEESTNVKDNISLYENGFVNKSKKNKKDKTENNNEIKDDNYSDGEIILSDGEVTSDEDKLRQQAKALAEAEAKEKLKNKIDLDFKNELESFQNLVHSDAKVVQNQENYFQNYNFNSYNDFCHNYNITKQWRKEKIRLRDEIKSGFLKLDFKGSNIASILGYGIGINNF